MKRQETGKGGRFWKAAWGNDDEDENGSDAVVYDNDDDNADGDDDNNDYEDDNRDDYEDDNVTTMIN